jgi:CBS domain-containing protein
MVDHRVGSVLVVDAATNRLEGIVSYTDILEKFCEMLGDRDS